MEEVLDIYKQPYDVKRPVVCMDESSKQLTKEVRESLPMMPKRVEDTASMPIEQFVTSEQAKANSSKSGQVEKYDSV